MGSQEVLGQAARLASSGLLLQVLCCARSSVWCPGKASGGGYSGFPALHGVPRGTTTAGRGAGSRSWESTVPVSADAIDKDAFAF